MSRKGCKTSLTTTVCPWGGPLATNAHEDETSGKKILDSVLAMASTLPDSARRVAVFDADGTLWRGDVGDLHLEYLVSSGLLGMAPGVEVLNRYQALCAEDVDGGYAYATSVMSGLELGQVQEAAHRVWETHDAQWMQPVTELLRSLTSLGWEAWIVSASNRWMVEIAVESLPVMPERVLGMEVQVEGGRLTEQLLPPITNGHGKVEAIRERIGVQPVLAVGNSVHDAPMLDHALLGILVSGGPEAMAADLAALAATSGWTPWDLAPRNP